MFTFATCAPKLRPIPPTPAILERSLVSVTDSSGSDMKRSITVKLILAFLAVSVTVVALASGITYWLTEREFKQLVFNQSRDRFVTDVGLYYQLNETWNGIQEYVTLRNSAPQPGGPAPEGNQQPPAPSGGQTRTSTFTFLLADAKGVVLVPAGTY